MREYPLVPLKNTVIFPRTRVNLTIGRDKSVRAVEEAHRASDPVKDQFIAAAQREEGIDDPAPEDIKRYFRALKKAQRDIDLRPELFTHYYKNEFPDRFHAKMDTRRWGPGERLVFEPYTEEVFSETRDWIASHGIFPDGNLGAARYEEATVSLP